MALSDLRLSKDMKYTALYTAMRFFEHEPDVFTKYYDNNIIIKIEADAQKVYINSMYTFSLKTHESFVKLECIDRLLNLGFLLDDIHCDESNILSFHDYDIFCQIWDEKFSKQITNNQVLYKSRLVSGILEYKSLIKHNDEIYNFGVFEKEHKFLKEINLINDDPDFVIEGNRLMRYLGKAKIVRVPDGITELESSCFWDNQFIEKVILPESLINLGGDTFYNCKNLKDIAIPHSVKYMGNNPFAGCPLIHVINHSPEFKMLDGALYSNDMKTMIYCSIIGESNEFMVPEGVQIICKHTFFLCKRLEKIILPKSLEKLENNPFSGCDKLTLINNSDAYHIIDDVIYNRWKTSVIGSLNKINSNRLQILEGTKTINRNSFWNCKGIKIIVLPSTLVDIGYNPFVGCSNIKFISNSENFKVIDDVLYNKNCDKLICYPAWKAIGEIHIPDSVLTLERGAFSGADKLERIHLHNINKINKTCFTNCVALKELYCSDLVTYIGEWAFAYCKSLKQVSVSKDTIVDNNAFSNCDATLVRRNERDNLLMESDNIFSLNSMLKNYKGKIDSILIDPPYNSHIDYIGYKDANYNEGYINFMRQRLIISYDLLSKNGFLVINIDNGEVDNLTNLCKNIFGAKLVSVHRWKKKHPYFDINRVVLNPNKVQTDYEFIIICRKSTNSKLNNIMQPYIEDGKIHEKPSDVPGTFDCFGTTSSAKDEIEAIFGRRDYFSTPKPVKLMKELIRATTNKNSIVMDFFAGSGTVGQAVVELNKEDHGYRKFVLISNDESNICKEVTKRRLEHIDCEFEFLD